MGRLIVLAYGTVAYAGFLLLFLYLIGFVGNFLVPKAIDTGPTGALGSAILINVLLLVLFAVQHTIMARPRFKAWLKRFIPQAAERSTFVLATILILALMCWQWRPLGAAVWSVDHVMPRVLLWTLFATGWGIVLYTSFLIDHFDLFGLRQVILYWRGEPYRHPTFTRRSLYKLVRHPLMLGFLIAVWATPEMSQGHLLFAAVITGYIFIGIQFEERDLVRHLGEDYLRYRRETPMILPLPKRGYTDAGKMTPTP